MDGSIRGKHPQARVGAAELLREGEVERGTRYELPSNGGTVANGGGVVEGVDLMERGWGEWEGYRRAAR